ncbi:hypothetical protein [Pelotalea chapellei]|uniref:Roadblock/LAMTOR2 domain-containing protein n=1 Tax=Pelotalea chapellei TaxID=44671 RepID=A0ABS5U4M1_9BACT|nr:hypothetical protein [Pelotalea chapellei]MBT1070625.1 hypothetical protein [Pelotalea chapellei]
MQDILHHLESIKGVIGSAVFSEKGEVLSNSFPALIDPAAVQECGAYLLECVHGLQVSETLELMDLRYNDGRVIVKHCPGILICLLCTRNVNLQMLAITLNMAVKRLENAISSEPAPVDAPSALHDSISKAGILRLPVAHLENREAAASFDSFGMIAISQNTGKQIRDFYNTSFKKLVLINNTTGTSGTFPVMVMPDMDLQYDGSILVGPGIEKKLKVNAGDRVEVRVE